MVDVVFDLLRRLEQVPHPARGGTERHPRVLQLADRGYLLRTGNIVATGTGPTWPPTTACSIRSSASKHMSEA